MKKKPTQKLPFKPTEEVRSDYWHLLSLQQLWEQKVLLQKRLDYISRIGNYDMRKNLERGMSQLMEVIDQKYKTEERDPRSPLLY